MEHINIRSIYSYAYVFESRLLEGICLKKAYSLQVGYPYGCTSHALHSVSKTH